MAAARKHVFQVGQIGDGQYVAASVSTPIFCFVGASAQEVEEKAKRACRFYYGDEGERFPAPAAAHNHVISFVPEFSVESELEAA